tara:strand:+ start:549 stop:1577 length:1029 start_codon:yes stop_codon:yes gene_type:complete
MAHLVETMAYAGEVPWHGLGKKVNTDMTPEEMADEAGLNWTVTKRRAYTTTLDGGSTNIYRPDLDSLVMVPDHYFMMRNDTNKILSHCGENYVPFQNKEVMSFFKKFTEAGNMQMETAGSLKEGKEIWGLAKLRDGFTLPGGDEVEGYLLLNNSHKAGKAMSIMFTPIRVVCNNTLTLALNQNGQKFRVLHLQMFDEEIMNAAEEALGLSDNQMKTFTEQANFLSTKKATDAQVANYVAELFQPNVLLERGKATNQFDLPPLRDELKHSAQSVLEAIETSPGAGLQSARGTWWGALNGVTYFVDHKGKNSSQDKSLHSAWFGSGANRKTKALQKAVEYAQAA